jgi:hypothetical protein
MGHSIKNLKKKKKKNSDFKRGSLQADGEIGPQISQSLG